MEHDATDTASYSEEQPKTRGISILRHNATISLLVAFIVVLFVGPAAGFSLEEEIKLGEEVAGQVEAEMPPTTNQLWQDEIVRMGERFLPHINRKEISYSFKVVKAGEEINAFALPGGHIYFTERMWRMMTPDERAGILAHEITHSDQRHGIDMMIKSNQRALWMLPLILLTGGTSGAAEMILWGDMIISQRYSRKMEREADEMGIKLLSAAGYNPAGAVTAMKKLLSMEADHNHYEVSTIFSSHPDTLKRVEYLAQAAIELGAQSSDLELKSVEDPSRLGNVTKKLRDHKMIEVQSKIPLGFKQKVLVKKMLWDDKAQALVPKTVAVATVLSPGKTAALTFDSVFTRDNIQKFYYGDVMEGDGIYPAVVTPLAQAAQTPSDTTPGSGPLSIQ